MMLGPFLWSSRDFGEKNSSIFGEELFFGLHLNFGKKALQYSVKTFFYGLHLICFPEKDRGRGSSPNVKNRAKLG